MALVAEIGFWNLVMIVVRVIITQRMEHPLVKYSMLEGLDDDLEEPSACVESLWYFVDDYESRVRTTTCAFELWIVCWRMETDQLEAIYTWFDADIWQTANFVMTSDCCFHRGGNGYLICPSVMPNCTEEARNKRYIMLVRRLNTVHLLICSNLLPIYTTWITKALGKVGWSRDGAWDRWWWCPSLKCQRCLPGNDAPAISPTKYL